mgnify:CR=1 FL=1
MGKIRFGYSDDFTAKNSSVGINTTEPQQNLDVIGVVKGKDLAVPGISSLTAYEGFLRADYQVAENTTLRFDQGSSASLSGEIIVGTGQTVTVSKVEDEFANANDGTVWSTYLSNSAGGFQDAYPASNAFNGKISATETSRSVNSQITSTWTPPEGITYSTSVEVWTYYAGSVSLNGGAAITVNNDQSWRKIGSGSGTLTSITFSSNSGNSVYIAGIAIDGEILVDGFSTPVDKGARAGGSEIECLKVFNTFTPPSGGTNERPYAPKPGELYYNYDLKTIEFFDGNGWRQVDNTTRSGRGLFGGGTSPGPSTRVDWIETLQISTLGNTQDFGDLTQARESLGGAASSVRGVFSGGLLSAPTNRDEIDYVTIASAGNAIDFGNVTDSGRRVQNSLSSSTRGVNLGGYKDSISQNVNIMDYIEIATTGNALDFGDITTKRRGGGACSSPTRGIYAGGFSSVVEEIIEFLTIASKGNTVRFGELSFRAYGQMGVSNTVRGIMAGGNQDGSSTGNRAEVSYITIASEGNAIYFGDLTVAREGGGTGASNSIRGVFTGGQEGPTRVNVIDYIAISTGGDAIDFGDLSAGIRKGHAGLSDSHGGLGGF